MTQHGDHQEIEAQIEQDRASLANTLDELQDRVSVDGIARGALGVISSNAAVYTKAIDEAVRSNPLAVALTGIGLAWLVFGSKKPAPDPAREVISRWEDEGGNELRVHTDHDADDNWSRELDALRERAVSTLESIGTEARGTFTDLRIGTADHLHDARDFASERAAVLTDFAKGIGERLGHGLEGLSEGAREKVIAMREAAYMARLRAQNIARSGTHEAGRLIEENPLVAGTISLVIGAALASALPRTQTEDRAFGPESDRLMQEASQLLKAERTRMGRIVETVGDELRSGVKDAVNAVSETLSETTGNPPIFNGV